MSDAATTRDYYERLYAEQGFGAQRRYPNEELCRFMGRNFFAIPNAKRAGVRILEVGCGSGANLWMIAREGFDTHGVDLSEESIALARQMLAQYGCKATLRVANMLELDDAPGGYDAVVDVFSSYCLNATEGHRFLQTVHEILKPGGLFFSYFPSKSSDAYTNHKPATLVDEDTLSGIYRQDSPFSGNHYPFRFLHPNEYEQMLVQSGFEVKYSETVSRTYGSGKEVFSFITIEARKL